MNNILITGSSGRVGSAIYAHLANSYSVVGLDRLPSATTDLVGDIQQKEVIDLALEKVDIIIHSAALHAPHVDLFPDSDFNLINVKATENLMKTGCLKGIKHFVFTSTTALYGKTSTPSGKAGWIDESKIPQPRTIYHKTKIEAEKILSQLSEEYSVPVTVLQMSRCFPEAADLMAVYRLHRGIDVRDVAVAHELAFQNHSTKFRRFIISSKTPFDKSHCNELFSSADAVLRRKAPLLTKIFEQKNWQLPQTIDRVYDSSLAQKELNWEPQYGFESVLAMLEKGNLEVLPVLNNSLDKG